jgi:hypothetical protein
VICFFNIDIILGGIFDNVLSLSLIKVFFKFSSFFVFILIIFTSSATILCIFTCMGDYVVFNEVLLKLHFHVVEVDRNSFFFSFILTVTFVDLFLSLGGNGDYDRMLCYGFSEGGRIQKGRKQILRKVLGPNGNVEASLELLR